MTPEVTAKFASYPKPAASRLKQLRDIIHQIAAEQSLGDVTESLKWNEPSYSVKGGSPVRFDWKAKHPEQIALYFICTTSLVGTFRELYRQELDFEGQRAIVLSLDQPLPEAPLRHCIELALRYQQLKHLPLLGA
ncbi:DUF1801 domain-containing protein [Saccharospirillum mangrovi]|uniref:DUF1801 domain-containing protein n=1 Tax=Saccharospirillum mangrovi TaxID=2161747 RepID=UPI000D356328|nr:DUF1801 domain-containing protein [Saccharospirillum mangrovi]